MPGCLVRRLIRTLSEQEQEMKKLVFAVMVTFVFATPTALAQESLLEYVHQSCEADISKFCDQVTPGDGRLVYCIAAHEDKVSSQCTTAFYNAADALEALLATVVYIAESCFEDIEAYCADTPMGEGRILACLEAHDDEVSATCRSTVTELSAADE
jgi:hypothetical protein